MENKIQELTDKIYREGVEKETKKRKDLSRMLRMKQRRSLRMLVKKRNQLLLPLVNLLMNWQIIQNQS